MPPKPLHLAVGMFDGVHLGHQTVIETAVQSAKGSNGYSAVLTFWPHPSRLFHPDEPVKMIHQPEVKQEVLLSHNVQYIFQQDFTPEFSAIPAAEFLHYLKSKLPNLASIHIGSNWKFGKKRLGDVDMLLQLGKKEGVHVINVERIQWDGEAVSSTRIRRHLEQGHMDIVNSLLGYIYFNKGTVVRGKRLGNKLGFPTLNLMWEPELAPTFGVYCVKVEGKGTTVPGIANFGLRPTVEDTLVPVLEIHLLDDCPFGEGDDLKVEWHQFIRPEQKFDGVESLVKQISADVVSAKRFWRMGD